MNSTILYIVPVISYSVLLTTSTFSPYLSISQIHADNKLKCTLCGSQNPWVTCAECAGQIFCASCDDMFHKHPKRKQHIRKARIEFQYCKLVHSNSRLYHSPNQAVEQGTPPIPPKAQAGAAPPVAPPRRSKRGLLTPFLGRKEQVRHCTIS